MFNSKRIPVLQVLDPDGTHTYPMAHDAAAALVRNAYQDDRQTFLTVKAADGTHFHPVAQIHSVHLLMHPDHAGASVELWQDHAGGGSLYLIDPETRSTAWRINTHQLKAGMFAHVAQSLIEGGAHLGAISSPVDVDSLVDKARVAVYRPGIGTVVDTERIEGATLPVNVAGRVALGFIGDNTTPAPGPRAGRGPLDHVLTDPRD